MAEGGRADVRLDRNVTSLHRSRAAELKRLTSSRLDVLVIGGGITGAGVALDAASRGYSVGLVEQGDFASGTSSRSTKLIHGGLRYLAKGQLRLVREALRERTLLLHLAPWLVQPQPFLVPLYTHLHRPLGVHVPLPLRHLVPLGVRLGLWGYDRFARSGPLAHRRVSLDEVGQQVPGLASEGLRAAYLYYDARTDDVRLTHTVLETARRIGAITINYARAYQFRYESDRVTGVRIEDSLTGKTHEVAARHVVNATGIWTEHVAELDAPPPMQIRHSKGIHLVLRKGCFASDTAVVIPETDDGRLLFLTPWSGHMLLGTTDDLYAGALDAPKATVGEIVYLLEHANRYLRPAIGPNDITGLYAGLRPLIASSDAAPSALSREHAVVTSPRGLISIVGGKLTTYRKMAEDTVDEIVQRDGEHRPCPTASLGLTGTEGWEDARAELAASGLRADQQEHLAAAYGARAVDILAIALEAADLRLPLTPDEPVLSAEVRFACRAELCVSLADFMLLRSRLSIVAEDAGASAVTRVANLMASELEWDAGERTRQHAMWEAAVARERRALNEVQAANLVLTRAAGRGGSVRGTSETSTSA